MNGRLSVGSVHMRDSPSRARETHAGSPLHHRLPHNRDIRIGACEARRRDAAARTGQNGGGDRPVCVPARPRLRLGEPLKQADLASTEKKNMNNRTLSHALQMTTPLTPLVPVPPAPM